MAKKLDLLKAHRIEVLACRRCPDMLPPSVCGNAVSSALYLLGQAPGTHEGRLGKPFAYTAGKTMFAWFERIGPNEQLFRRKVYMAAVARCFPGKAKSGGDRLPNRTEIETCSSFIKTELSLLEPKLVIAVGRLAIEEVAATKIKRLTEVVGTLQQGEFHGYSVDWIALPHPSGLSTWYKTEPGKGLLAQALKTLSKHPAWKKSFG